MKIYISGPITGKRDYMKRFQSAEKQLKAEGHTVINPARVNAALPEGTTHAEYMKTSIVMLDMCDAIFMLDGWQQSKGCSIEFEYAYEHGITITFEGGTEGMRAKCEYEDKGCSRACIHATTCEKWKLRSGKTPCRDCMKRSETCHIECLDYKEWSRKRQEQNAEIRKKRKLERYLNPLKIGRKK